jgi:hypothetical protein
MKEFLSHLHLAKPIFLVLFFLLPLFWIRWRGHWAVILWRCIIFSLLVIGLADPEWVSIRKVTPATGEGERVFAFDLSRSIPIQMRQWMEQFTKERLLPSEKDRMFIFGGDTQEAKDWDQWLRGERSAKPIQPGRTNLEKLFSVLLSLPERPRNVFLFTDGWENEGTLERLLPSLVSYGIKVFPLLPSDRLVIANVPVTKLLSPTHGNSGEAVNLKVVLENYNDREVDGTLTWMRNGQPFKTDAVKLKPGSQIFTYQTTLPDGPLISYRVSFMPQKAEFDNYAPDDRGRFGSGHPGDETNQPVWRRLISLYAQSLDVTPNRIAAARR